jgi:hypothetical protein
MWSATVVPGSCLRVAASVTCRRCSALFMRATSHPPTPRTVRRTRDSWCGWHYLSADELGRGLSVMWTVGFGRSSSGRCGCARLAAGALSPGHARAPKADRPSAPGRGLSPLERRLSRSDVGRCAHGPPSTRRALAPTQVALGFSQSKPNLLVVLGSPRVRCRCGSMSA